MLFFYVETCVTALGDTQKTIVKDMRRRVTLLLFKHSYILNAPQFHSPPCMAIFKFHIHVKLCNCTVMHRACLSDYARPYSSRRVIALIIWTARYPHFFLFSHSASLRVIEMVFFLFSINGDISGSFFMTN